MKKIDLLALGLLLVIGYGCATIGYEAINCTKSLNKQDRQKIEASIQVRRQLEDRFIQIHRAMVDKGYLDFKKLEEIFGLIEGKNSLWYVEAKVFWRHHPRSGVPMCTIHGVYRHSPNIHNLLATAIERNYMPFKPAFYQALEKEKYEEAEQIRRGWVVALEKISDYFQNYYFTRGANGQPNSLEDFCIEGNNNKESAFYPYREKDPKTVKVTSEIQYQIEKLTSVVGLTDPMLIDLRKELMTAIKQKKWDDAQKIQNLITARENKLRPPQPHIVYKEVPSKGGDTTVTVQQPSELTVTHKKSHGAEDWLKAGSLLSGKGYSSKELGAAKAIDMIFGW